MTKCKHLEKYFPSPFSTIYFDAVYAEMNGGSDDLLTQEVGGRLNRGEIDEAGFHCSFEVYRNTLQYNSGA